MGLDITYKKALAMVRYLTQCVPDPNEVLSRSIDIISASNPLYDWVGIYLLNNQNNTLELFNYFIGAPTPHIRIDIHEGICGAAVREGTTIIVPDVHADPRYLACSLETRSEIVVPIRKGSQIVGEIDIDSHKTDAFEESDRIFLEKIATMLGTIL